MPRRALAVYQVKPVKRLALLALVLLAFLMLGPFLVPIPPLKGVVPPEQLADPDSRFVEVQGIRLHYKVAGQGEPHLVLLHGFAASTFTWREVMQPLAQVGSVVAFDRPAHGLTQRPMPGEWQGDSPYGLEAQSDQTLALLDALGSQRAVLIGNSAGGTVALLTALRHPERVEALVLVDAAVYDGGGPPAWAGLLLETPQARRLGPLLARSISLLGDRLGRLAWNDPSRLDAEFWEGYRKPLQVENWDRALWELTRARRPLDLEQRLDQLSMPVLVITGDDDRIVPTEQSIRLAREVPGAELVVIPACGHVPHEECPEAFLEAVTRFLANLPTR